MGSMTKKKPDRFSWEDDDPPIILDRYLHPIQQEHEAAQAAAAQQQPGEEEGDEQYALDLEDDEGSVAPWQALEEDDDGPICQGPFWPSPDDPNTGYCTCCEQVYQGDLLKHPCLSAGDQDDDGEIEDDGDEEDTAKRPAIKP